MLKRLLKSVMLAVLTFSLVTGTLLAAWEYLFPVTIVDTSNTTRTYYPVMLGFGGQTLVDAAKISSNGTDTNMQIGSSNISYMMSTTNVTAVIPNLPSGGVVTTNLYTGYDPAQSGFPIIPGSGGYVTVSDNASLEFGSNNYTVRQVGYVETSNSSDKNLGRKPYAFKTFVSPTVSGNITSAILTPVVSSWVSPTGFVDGGGTWSNEPNAYDDNVATAADETIGAFAWGNVLELTHAPISVTSLRFYANHGAPATLDNIDIDVYSNGVWYLVYQGAYADSVWVTQNLTSPREVTSARVSFSNGGGAPSAVAFFEFDFGEAADSVVVQASVTGVTSSNHTVQSRADAALLELLVDTDNLIFNSDFEIGDPSTEWTLVGAGATTNRSIDQVYINTYSLNLTRSGVNTYVYQELANPTSYQGDNLTLGGWVYATVASRARIALFDDVIGYSNSAFHSGVAGWEWLTVTKTIDVGATAVSTRLRIMDGDTTAYFDGVNLVEGSSVPQTPPIPTTVALGAASVPDNSIDWVFMQNDVMPYADNITISVNGTQQLYLAPLVMLSGTNIPDRSGNSHNGTITWGSNSGISLSYGEMTSYEDFVATSNITSGFSVPTASMPSTWFAGGENALALPFYDSFSSVAAQTGKPVQSYYLLAIIGLAFGVFLGLVTFTRSALMGYIAMVMVFGVGASMTIVPAWIVFVLIIVGAGIMFLYKQVAY